MVSKAYAVTVSLPESKAYLKVLDVPYFRNGQVWLTPERVATAMERSIWAEHFVLAGPPRPVRNSRHADTATVFFTIFDSQQGARARILTNRILQVDGQNCRIRPSTANPGAPLCTRCWRWGHPSDACRQQARRCGHCDGPHGNENHRALCALCHKGNPKANPPMEPTPPNMPCPHLPWCRNCGKQHSADNRKCIFWNYRFNREWIERRYKEVREGRPLRTPKVANTSH